MYLFVKAYFVCHHNVILYDGRFLWGGVVMSTMTERGRRNMRLSLLFPCWGSVPSLYLVTFIAFEIFFETVMPGREGLPTVRALERQDFSLVPHLFFDTNNEKKN